MLNTLKRNSWWLAITLAGVYQQGAAAPGAAVIVIAFLVHTFTAERPFMRSALFRDRNFSAGVIFSVVTFITLYASLALQPPYLQDLMNYPVFTADLVMGPRGVGTMAATARS
jgi:MFS transporter, DHA2 family, multidrug resistance protein